MNLIGVSSVGDEFWESIEGGTPDFIGDSMASTYSICYYRRSAHKLLSGQEVFSWYDCASGGEVNSDKKILELERGRRDARKEKA